MHTKLIRFHSGKKIGTVIRPDFERSAFLRDGFKVRALRRDMRIGDLAACYESPSDDVMTLHSITRIEIMNP